MLLVLFSFSLLVITLFLWRRALGCCRRCINEWILLRGLSTCVIDSTTAKSSTECGVDARGWLGISLGTGGGERKWRRSIRWIISTTALRRS